MKRTQLFLSGGMFLWLVASVLATATAAMATSASPPLAQTVAIMDSAAYNPDVESLGRLIWQQNPEVYQARLGLAQNRSELLRASLWQNPTLQAGAASIPLSRRMLNTPNYPNNPLDPLVGPNLNISFSQPVEFGKRDLRIQRYRYTLKVAEKNLELLYYQRVADLAEVLVQMGVSCLRQELLTAQVAALEGLLQNVRLSVEKGFAPPLDAERLALELGRLQVDKDAEQLTFQGLGSEWARLTLSVAPMLTPAEANVIVARWCTPPAFPTMGSLTLPQQSLLEAQQAETKLDLELAQRMAWPDPTFEMGYAYDSLPTGNVMHSLSTSIALEIPVWQYGQAEARSAVGYMAEIKQQQAALQAHLAFQAPALQQRMLTLQKNIQNVQEHRLVLARGTLQRYEQALNARGITLNDLIQTRRTVLDLESERLELLEQMGLTLVNYSRLTHWNLPKPEGVTP